MSVQSVERPRKSYQRIGIKPLTGALGAEIEGVDLSRPLEPAVADEILRAFQEHLVIYFRDQKPLTPEQHIQFAGLFGALQPIPHIFSIDGYPQVQKVLRETDDKRRVVGGAWHNDSTFMDTPPTAVIMRAIDIPEVGGDTLFTNLYRAYETLSPKMREIIDGLDAIHSGKKLFGTGANQKTVMMKTMDTDEGDRETVHPVVPRHPVTGRKHLFVNTVFTQRIDGMTEEESRPLLGYLYEHAALPEFTCRVRWENNMVLVWDNRAAYHRAVPDYAGHRRYLERVTTGGVGVLNRLEFNSPSV